MKSTIHRNHHIGSLFNRKALPMFLLQKYKLWRQIHLIHTPSSVTSLLCAFGRVTCLSLNFLSNRKVVVLFTGILQWIISLKYSTLNKDVIYLIPMIITILSFQFLYQPTFSKMPFLICPSKSNFVLLCNPVKLLFLYTTDGLRLVPKSNTAVYLTKCYVTTRTAKKKRKFKRENS